MITGAILKILKINTASTTYIDIIPKRRVRTKTHLKNLSFLAPSGEESRTNFKVVIGEIINFEDIKFTTGSSFNQDFNIGEIVLKRGDTVHIQAKADSGTINPTASYLLLEEGGK